MFNKFYPIRVAFIATLSFLFWSALTTTVFAGYSTIHDLGYPFPAGETWQVIQGYYSPNGTHNCCPILDLTKVNSAGNYDNELTKNATVVAAVEGTLESVFSIEGGAKGYGVRLRTDDGYKVQYTHINKTLLVPEGSRVKKGTPIATVFPVSLGGWVHLDFGVRNKNGAWIPVDFGDLKFPNDPSKQVNCSGYVKSQYCGVKLQAWQPADYANIITPCKPDLSCPVYRFYNWVKGHHIWTSGAAERGFLANDPNWRFEGIAYHHPSSSTADATPVYRIIHKENGNYFYGWYAEANAAVQTGAWQMEGPAFHAFKTNATGRIPVYRLWNNKYQRHFYTPDTKERDWLVNSGEWKAEGTAFFVGKPTTCYENTCPVFRLWNDTAKQHFYTRDFGEVMSLLTKNTKWKSEGVEFYAHSSAAAGRIAIYRFYNPNTGAHYFSQSQTAKSAPWVREGIAFYAYPKKSTLAGLVDIKEYWNKDFKAYYYTRSSANPGGAWQFQRNAFKAKTSY